MPNRWIKESCRSSKNLSRVSDMAERLFWRLITTADDYGRFIADVDIIKGVCFPLVDRIKIKDIEKCLHELASAQLLKLYTIEDRQYGYFLKWEAHQGKPRAQYSKYPLPQTHMEGVSVDQSQNQQDRAFQFASANGCEQLHTVPYIPALTSISDTETDLNLNSPNSLKSEEEVFDEFWEAYPKRNGKKIGKDRSRHLFASLGLEAQRLAITAAVNYGRSERVQNGYCKDPERFLKASFWREWIEPETPQASRQVVEQSNAIQAFLKRGTA